ncbi:glycosyltransferase [Candidatus Woesearchaeota archaeon]|nr:glycosyltransferase [Candidatus Woesearchaeota archaeon]
MGRLFNKYRAIVGDEAIGRIEEKASPFSEKHVVHVNSTYYGGGVAEILKSLVVLMNDIGVETGWRMLRGNPEFFEVTKRFHNGLQGEKIYLSERKKEIYVGESKLNSLFMHIQRHDFAVIHDPQPLPLINYYKKKGPWIWRCHIDITNPNRKIWNYLTQFIVKYDAMIVSEYRYKKKLPIPQHVIAPSIDPLDPKNMDMRDSDVAKYLRIGGIDLDKPLITQVSRFDKWKDPLGVIEVFNRVREKVDCKLLLLGNFAPDDPEGQGMYDEIMARKGDNKDILVINQTNRRLVNAVQRASAVVIQKSIKEGFGLTVSEALWKGTPVVGSMAGGIPLQIRDGVDGYLTSNKNECAKRVIELLNNRTLAKKMGESGKEWVRKNFLTTRHMEDYLDLFASLSKK